MVSRTIVPMQTRSQPASLSRVTCALKSVSVGRDATEFQLHRLDLSHDTGVTILAEVGVLVHRPDHLLALHLGEILHAGSHLIIVRGELAVFVLVERFVHRSGTGQREHTGHTLLEHHRQHRIHLRGAAAAERQEDVVEVDQLVHGLDRLRDQILHVLDDEADLAAVDAALRVDLFERHADRVRGIAALHRRDAGQVGHHADDDLGVGYAARCGDGASDDGG